MVAEAIEERYPESSYLPLLASEIARMDARQNLMSNIAETNFPDVELPDMFGRKVRLEFVAGKGRAGGFLVGRVGNSNAINAELKEVYAEYADRGIRNLPDRCGCFERSLDQRRAGAAASLDFGLRFPGAKSSPHWGFTTCRNCLLTF